jgi:predicted DCC family thiol-disulfide oxidoreductase YuxK
MSESHGGAIEVFYDGGCPVCLREVRVLRRLDRRGRIQFTDIDAAGFQVPLPGPASDELMARIHARTADGAWIEGVEVFRRLYTAVGLGPLVSVSRWPGIAQALDWGYAIFARNRTRWFGRCTTNSCAPGAAARQDLLQRP